MNEQARGPVGVPRDDPRLHQSRLAVWLVTTIGAALFVGFGVAAAIAVVGFVTGLLELIWIGALAGPVVTGYILWTSVDAPMPRAPAPKPAPPEGSV